MIRIKKNKIISKRDNEIVSIYSDDVWDLSVYRTKSRGAAKINFLNWIDKPEPHETIISEMKYIFYLLLNQSVGGRQSILAVTTVCGSYQVLMKRMARFAVSRNMHISDVLQSNVEIKRFADVGEHKPSMEALVGLLNKLIELGTDNIGIKVMRGVHITQLRAIALKRRSDEQAEFIPQRLLTEFIDHWQNVLAEFNVNWPRVAKFLDRHYEFPGSGVTIEHQRDKYGPKEKYEPDFPSLIAELELVDYFSRYGVTDVKKLSGHLCYIQSVGKAIIHIYSGMRYDEAISLNVDSLVKERVSSNLQRWIIKGETTKDTGRATDTYWVTSYEIGNAWNVLKNISNLITGRLDAKLGQPLFASISYLKLATGSVGIKNGIKCTALIEIDSLKHIGEHVKIIEADIKVLKGIDPHRDWSNSDYVVGNKWKVTSHQYRRTLAILAAQSGLVSIPSLKRQLKHTIEEITFHYSRGSTSLSNRDAMKLNDFAEMIDSCSAEAMAYSWMLDILFTTDTIVGESPISRRERDAAKKLKGKYLTESRITIYKQFESGERSYRSTSMGGCSQIEVCMERAHGSITACLPCPSSHIKLKKLDRAISNQGVFVKKLEVGSVERVVAERELNDLLSYREKWSDK